MPQNRPVVDHGQAPFTLILKVGKNDDTGRVFKIGRSIHDRHREVFDTIADHDHSRLQTTENVSVIGVVMPNAEQLILNFLIRILNSKGKATLKKSLPEKVLFKLAKVCQMYNCTDKIRSLVEWSTVPDFAAESETDESCLPEEIYFIGREFHLPKVMLIGWTRFIPRIFVAGKGFQDGVWMKGELAIHGKMWRGPQSRDGPPNSRDPLWELMEEDTKKEAPEIALRRLRSLFDDVHYSMVPELPCKVYLEKHGHKPKRTTACQKFRTEGLAKLCRKLDIPPDTYCETEMNRGLGDVSVERLAVQVNEQAHFVLDRKHAHCQQPRDRLPSRIERLLRSVPHRTPLQQARLESWGYTTATEEYTIPRYERIGDAYQACIPKRGERPPTKWEKREWEMEAVYKGQAWVSAVLSGNTNVFE